MDETLQMREARSVAITLRVFDLTDLERVRVLTYLCGLAPIAVEQAVAWVEDQK